MVKGGIWFSFLSRKGNMSDLPIMVLTKVSVLSFVLNLSIFINRLYKTISYRLMQHKECRTRHSSETMLNLLTHYCCSDYEHYDNYWTQ